MKNEFDFKLYGYSNKVPIKTCKEMLEIITKFYNNLNDCNYSDEDCNKWVKLIRNTKDYHVLLCYKGKTLIGFINYTYMNKDVMLSEVQIKEEYQKKGVLKVLLEEVIKNTKRKKIEYFLGTIGKKNINSQNVFTHIGFKLGEDNLYRITREDLVNWVTK